MSRCGAKSTQKEVKTNIVEILAENSEGLSFNQIFKQLKGKGVLGSYSVLSRALKDLNERHIISYLDIPTNAKIPRRVYTLEETKFRQYVQLLAEAKGKIEEPEKLVLDKSALERLFLNHTINLMIAYKTLLEEFEPNNQEAIWKLEVNIEFNYMQAAMESVAKAIFEDKIQIDDANNVAVQVLKELLQRFSQKSET